MLRSNPLYDNAYIGGRWKELLRLFESFKSAYESKNGGSAVLGIDEVALYQAVTSYFHDVARYKWWHFPDDPKQHRIDDSKKSAYMVYWLNKLRPIYVERPSADPADLEASLNDDTSIRAHPVDTQPYQIRYGVIEVTIAGQFDWNLL